MANIQSPNEVRLILGSFADEGGEDAADAVATQSTKEFIEEEFKILTEEAAAKMGMPVEGVIAILIGALNPLMAV